MGAFMLIVLVAFICGLGIWQEVGRESQDWQRRQEQAREKQWALDHPIEAAEQREKREKEAAELGAKFEREMAATNREINAEADCYRMQGFDAASSCLANVKRASLQECLQGPDWTDCPGMRPEAN
jgi:hypothetical protein